MFINKLYKDSQSGRKTGKCDKHHDTTNEPLRCIYDKSDYALYVYIQCTKIERREKKNHSKMQYTKHHTKPTTDQNKWTGKIWYENLFSQNRFGNPLSARNILFYICYGWVPQLSIYFNL